MTELERQLQSIAQSNWQLFVRMIGEDAITSAKICLLRQNQFTYGQIQAKLRVTKSQVEYGSKNCCPKNSDTFTSN